MVCVFLGKDLSILDRLDGGMIMILVNLTINSGCSLLMTVLRDGLVYNGWSNFFVYSGVVVTCLVPR